MTKSQHSATTPRIFSLIKVLGCICAIKIALLALLVAGVPLPEWLGGEHLTPRQTPSAGETAETARNAPLSPVASAGVAAAGAALPEGRPSVTGGVVSLDNLPVPERDEPLATDALASAFAPLPEAPAAPSAATPRLLAAEDHAPVTRDDSWFDVFSLRKLPIPFLGSARVANAAATVMPVPNVQPAPANSFSPAAQQMPYGYEANVLGNLPSGVAADAPLPPRGDGGAFGSLPALPSSGGGAVAIPAPNVQPPADQENPNTKAQELARQQQDMLLLREQMDQRLKDMQGAEHRMQDLIREARALEDKKMRSLILMYSNMKPKIAAKALENMDDRIAIRILSGMPPKQAGEILTYTSPQKTADFSELISRMKSAD